jgi:hypothetical protein
MAVKHENDNVPNFKAKVKKSGIFPAFSHIAWTSGVDRHNIQQIILLFYRHQLKGNKY